MNRIIQFEAGRQQNNNNKNNNNNNNNKQTNNNNTNKIILQIKRLLSVVYLGWLSGLLYNKKRYHSLNSILYFRDEEQD